MTLFLAAWVPTRDKLYRRIHTRLSSTGGCTNVTYAPTRLRKHEVRAEIDPTAFLGRSYSANTAKLRVQFWLGGKHPEYEIQWWEPANSGRGIGWHQDSTHPRLGTVHFQVEKPTGTTKRQSATFNANEHPYKTFERRLNQIPQKLQLLKWK